VRRTEDAADGTVPWSGRVQKQVVVNKHSKIFLECHSSVCSTGCSAAILASRGESLGL
jgi:hypothetical protein